MSNTQNQIIDEMIHEAGLEESPLPVEEEEKLLTFAEALQEALIGKRIQRKEWDKSEYGLFEGDFLHIFIGGKMHVWEVSKGDLVENDWIAF